jgi:hypothetical protein
MLNKYIQIIKTLKNQLLLAVAALFVVVPLATLRVYAAPGATAGAIPGCYTAADGGSINPSACGTSGGSGSAVADKKCFLRGGATAAYVEQDCATITVTPATDPGASGGVGGGVRENDCNAPVLDKTNCQIINYLIIFIDTLSALVGVVVVAAIVTGGIQYTTSADNPDKIQKAKHRITNALIGLFGYIFIFAFLQWVIPGGVL